MKNILNNIPEYLPEELFETLVKTERVQIERIVSRGHTTPEGEWYDQEKNEFVLLLNGTAKLEFEDGRVVNLEQGDWLEILAHQKHRVAWTDQTAQSIWLAIHY